MHHEYCNIICHLDRIVKGWDIKLVFRTDLNSDWWLCLRSSPRLSSMNSCGLGQLCDTNRKLWEWAKVKVVYLKEKGKNHCMNCGQQHVWTENDSLFVVLCLLLLAYILFSDVLVMTLFQRRQNLIIVFTSLILSVLWSCSSSHLGRGDSMKWGSVFMLKALLIFMMFLWLPPCCSWGVKKTDTAFLTLLPMRHLQKHISYWYTETSASQRLIITKTQALDCAGRNHSCTAVLWVSLGTFLTSVYTERQKKQLRNGIEIRRTSGGNSWCDHL